MTNKTVCGTSPRGPLNNAAWNSFATIWSIAISFLVAPLLIRYLGIEQYGLLLLVWSVTGLLGITNLGVGEATLRYVSHYHADGDMHGVNRVFGSTLAFYILISLVLSAVVFPATPMLVSFIKMPAEQREEARWLLRFAVLLFSIGMLSNAFRSVPMALQRYDLSSKIGLAQGTARTVGFAVLVVSGFGVLHVVVWELFVAGAVMFAQMSLARRLLPGIQLLPRFSLAGMREIFGYSIYVFLTQVFLSMYRESGKLILGNHVGPVGVAYLGTPDSIAVRIAMVVISGVETLMPRFSANRDPANAKALLVKATWAALTVSVVLFVPLAVLMPDFLELWISPEFARESGMVGRLLAISFIASAAFTPIATYFRGVGRPGFVTLVMAVVGIAVLATSFLLVPTYGPLGVAYGYLVGSVFWLTGLIVGWFKLFGRHSVMALARAVGVPLFVATAMFALELTTRSWVGEVGWTKLFLLGGTYSMLTCALAVSADLALGGDSLSNQLLRRFAIAGKVGAFRWLRLWYAR